MKRVGLIIIMMGMIYGMIEGSVLLGFYLKDSPQGEFLGFSEDEIDVYGVDCSKFFNKINDDKQFRDNFTSLETGYKKLTEYFSITKDKVFRSTRYGDDSLITQKTGKKTSSSFFVYPPMESVVAIKTINKEFLTTQDMMNYFIDLMFTGRQEGRFLEEIVDAFSFLQEKDYSSLEKILQGISDFIIEDPLQVRYTIQTEGVVADMVANLYLYPRLKELVSMLINKLCNFGYKIDVRGNSINFLDEVNVSFYLAVFLIYNDYYHNYSKETLCSGVVVSSNTIVTAAHCLHRGQKVIVNRFGKEIESLNIDFHYKFREYRSKVDKEEAVRYDIGVVVFPEDTFKGISPVSISKRKVGKEKVVVTGLDPITGEFQAQKIDIPSISSIIRINPKRYDFAAQLGNSGSPMLDFQDELVGLLVASKQEKIDQKQKIYNYYVRVEENLDYLQSVNRMFRSNISGLD